MNYSMSLDYTNKKVSWIYIFSYYYEYTTKEIKLFQDLK